MMMTLRNDMHGGIVKNFAHGFHGAVSEPAIGAKNVSTSARTSSVVYTVPPERKSSNRRAS